ncbi:hypothetical protein AgCh_031094 [Apium graveolens]
MNSSSSSSLWVGNLSGDATEADLTNLFGKYGAIVKITLYSSKFFAFVHFKLPQHAKSAKDSLNATLLRGSPLKIDFAKPAKPCKSLWVGGISPSVTKEELEEQFCRFGKIQEFKFLRERNTAYVDYFAIEDATEALKTLNGLEVGGNLIRVDYLRSQASRKNIQSPVGPKGDGQPSKILWVSYPPSFPMDKQMLHNAMILFGEIEGITLFPSGSYSLVEFRSVEEAKLAKEGLEGRLFSDPRILILYSNSEAVPSNGQSSFYSEVEGPRTDVLSNDVQGYSQIVPFNIAGNATPHGVNGPDISRRPFLPLGSFEPLHQRPDFSLTKHHKLQDSNTNLLVGVSNRKRLSPSPGVLSSPSQSVQPSIRPVSSTWDVYDASRSQRESKRSRVGGLSALSDPSLETIDAHYLGLNEFHGHGQQVGVIRGAAVTSMNRSSPSGSRVSTGVTFQSHSEHDCIWRGVIAKGGQHVCRARCVPLEKKLEFEIPEVVNCSARTGLDMLAKHYGDAVGFNIIFFLPDSVEDFAPYTEFLRYLGAKNRAGVAKFDDGTTLFLVPPSDFLKNTLNIAGPERLYGVVLKFQSHVLGSTAEHTTLQQNYIDRPMMPFQIENRVMLQEERFTQTDYNRSMHENPNSLSKLVASSTNSNPGEAVPATSTSLSHAGVTLTPELIATLASLLPAKANTLASQSLSESSNPRPIQTPIATDCRHQHGWDYEQKKFFEQSGHLINQAGYHYSPQGQFPLDHHYLLGQNAPSYAAQGVVAKNQIEDATFNMRHGDVSTNFVIHSHGGKYLVQPQTNHQYQVETSQETRHGYAQGIDASVSYSASPLLPDTNSLTSHQVSNSTVSKRHIGNPMDGANFGLDSQKQTQHLQSYPGAVQGPLNEETDKNERYRSTLQFAANLLLQIQQNPGSESGQGPGNN